MMLECKEAVVQAICVTIAEKTVLQFLGSLNMKECKKPEKTSVKESFKHLLESITSCEEPGFLCTELSGATRHVMHIMACYEVPAKKTEESLAFIKDMEGTDEELPILKALRSHANGALLMITAEASMKSRELEIESETKINELIAMRLKIQGSDTFETLSTAVKDVAGAFTALNKMATKKKGTASVKASIDEAGAHTRTRTTHNKTERPST